MPIEIRGIDKLFKKLERVKAVQTLDPPMQRSLMRLQRFMQYYPPAPPKSKYIRGRGFPGRRATSEKYGHRWNTRVVRSAHGLMGKVGNNASYAPWVGSSQFQTWFHARTGWHTDAQAIEENQAEILADFQQAIDAALAS